MVEKRGGTHFLTVVPIREIDVFVPLILLILPQPPSQLGKLVIKTHDRIHRLRNWTPEVIWAWGGAEEAD